MKKTPSTIQLSRLKSAAKSVNYRQGFWSGLIKEWYNEVANFGWMLIKRNNRLFLGRLLRYRPNWRDVAIALLSLLLGLLLAKSAPTHIIRDQIGGFSPAPAIFSVKPLPLLKEVSYKPVGGLDVVWVDKRRPTGTYANDYAAGNCTWYVASRLPIPNSMGDANNWAYAASLAGYTVSNVPKVGAIAQTGGDSWAGHVAIVESVNPDGTFVVSEMNYNGLGVVDTRTTSTAEFPNFIYV